MHMGHSHKHKNSKDSEATLGPGYGGGGRTAPETCRDSGKSLLSDLHLRIPGAQRVVPPSQSHLTSHPHDVPLWPKD